MARNTDVADPRLRDLLLAAEEAIDRRDYSQSVDKTIAAYALLMAERPDVIINPNDRAGAAASFDRILSRQVPRPWPGDTCGVELVWGDTPSLRRVKERYTFSDAVTLMEYTLDTAMRAQRQGSSSASQSSQ